MEPGGIWCKFRRNAANARQPASSDGGINKAWSEREISFRYRRHHSPRPRSRPLSLRLSEFRDPLLPDRFDAGELGRWQKAAGPFFGFELELPLGWRTRRKPN